MAKKEELVKWKTNSTPLSRTTRKWWTLGIITRLSRLEKETEALNKEKTAWKEEKEA